MVTAIDTVTAVHDGRSVYNFGAGPAMLPESVLHELQQDIPNHQGSGISILEMNHRSPGFQNIIDQAEQDLRELMQIPDDYAVLFLHGGATLQFAMAPLNLLGSRSTANYANTGHWSARACAKPRGFVPCTRLLMQLPPGIRIFHPSPSGMWTAMLLICITRSMRPSVAWNSTGSRIHQACHWLLT